MLIKSEQLREKIKQACKEKGWGHTDLAREAGITYDDVRTFIGGRVLKPSYFTVQAMMQALGLDDSVPTAPFVGSVSCGIPIEPWIDEDAPQVAVPFYIKNGYVLRLVGDSMNKEIPEDYLILVDPNIGFLNELDKKIVILNVNGERSCKKYMHSIRQAVPCSTNLSHKSISLKEPENQIIGKVVHAFINYGI